jgi:hypothetical protein
MTPEDFIDSVKEEAIKEIEDDLEAEGVLMTALHDVVGKTTALIERLAPQVQLNDEMQLQVALKTFGEGESKIHELEAKEVSIIKHQLFLIHSRMALNLAKIKAIQIGRDFKKNMPNLPEFFVSVRTMTSGVYLPSREGCYLKCNWGYNTRYAYKHKDVQEILENRLNEVIN